MLPNGNISVFDNGGVPKVHPQSRGLIESIDAKARTGTVVAPVRAPGAAEVGQPGQHAGPANGDVFIGWGAEPYFSEFSASGTLLFDAHFHGSYQAYRGYRFAWTGSPGGSPPRSRPRSAGS